MANFPMNSDDTIDSRDIVHRIEELEAMHEDLASDVKVGLTTPLALADWAGFFGDELAALKALSEEASSYADDWEYGVTLIRDSYFRVYAEELADDFGITIEDSWPHNCIDWERAARELQQDYTSVEFSGVTYWVR